MRGIPSVDLAVPEVSYPRQSQLSCVPITLRSHPSLAEDFYPAFHFKHQYNSFKNKSWALLSSSYVNLTRLKFTEVST